MNFFRYIYFNKLVNRLNRNLSIKQKSYLAFFLMMLMIAAFSAYILVSYFEIESRQENIHAVNTIQKDYLQLEILLQKRCSLVDSSSSNVVGIRNKNILESTRELKLSINKIKNEESISDLDLQKLLNILTNIETSSIFNKNSSNILSEANLQLIRQSCTEIVRDLGNFDKKADEFISNFTEQTNLYFKRKNISIYVYLIIAMFFSIIIANYTSLRITNPIKKLKDNIKILEQGDFNLDSDFEVLDNDEIKDISNGIERIGQTIKETVVFTEKIGRNEFDADLKVNRSGKLAVALLSMRDNLKEVTDQNKIQKEIEEKRNWVIKGLADLGNILRSETDDINTLYFDILKTIIKYIGANQGGLFIIQEKDNEKVLELSSCYAYDRRKYLSKEIEIGEGLVGQCAYEKQLTNITDIPDKYIEITSGLGNSNPNNLVLVPLILNDEIYGVVELASFDIFDKHHIEYLEQSAESIASTISNMQVNITTKSLLEKTQAQAEQMSAQEEEMRQNMEELEATQEESERKVEHYEKMLEEANKKLKEKENSSKLKL